MGEGLDEGDVGGVGAVLPGELLPAERRRHLVEVEGLAPPQQHGDLDLLAQIGRAHGLSAGRHRALASG